MGGTSARIWLTGRGAINLREFATNFDGHSGDLILNAS
jgi:hypothetical protein